MRPPLHYDGKQHKEEGIEVDLLGTAFDETLTSASTIYLEDIPVPSAQDFAVVKVRPEDMHHFDEIPTLKPADAKTSKPVLFSAINGPAEYTESVCNWYKRELIPTKFEFDSAVERLKPGHVTEWITPERLQVGYCEANQATFARYRLFTSPGCSGSLISQDKRFVGIHVCAAQAPVDHESHSTGILIGTAVAKDFFRVALADLVEDDPDWRMFVGPDPTVVRQEYWPSRFVNSLLSKVNLVRGKEDTGSIEMKREKHGFQQDDMHDGQEWRRQLQQHQQLQHEDAMLQARKEPVTAHATKLPVAVRRTPEQGSIRELQHTIGSGAAPESTDELPAIREGGEVSKLKNFDRGTQLVYEGKDNGAVDPKPLKARPPSPTPSETSADGRASQSENFRVGLLKLDTMEGDGPEEERSRNRIGAWLSEM
ncbi:hypothetical protein BJ508DRAFT_332968 [Ascobolus immersus RN42]|uniref:Uncharacterized protein n=1 Tax=Ascobolus immersus RN42 TaxID=1160509 RepID=A0A3N4HPY6_ASCIM|nr:hypothetical protein BJ508DRAFT_332968 [Ascobolus immersus RN42]